MLPGVSVEPVVSWFGADPDAPDFRDALHERYRHLREVAPVNLNPRGMWRLTRYEDVLRLLKRTKVGVRTVEGELPNANEAEMPRLFMLEQDAPTHTRLRRVVARYFTPRAMDALHTRVEELTDELLDELGTGEIDLASGLALPLPTAVICEMMGVPVGDREVFTQWSSDLTYFLLGTNAPPEKQAKSKEALGHMVGYVQQRAAERKANPGNDLLSVLLQAEGDDTLNPMEFLWQAIGLILAGFETTTGLIGNGIRQLLLHPDQLARLREDPTLIDSAVEECLRFDPPIIGTVRFLHEEAEFGDYTLAVNSRVLAVLAAANRDPEVFEDPDTFDIGRSPNPNLGFGGGPHMCLGAHLARLEARVAISKLVARYPSLELLDEKPEWSPSLFRIPARLRVRAS
jgi:cytochrome P450